MLHTKDLQVTQPDRILGQSGVLHFLLGAAAVGIVLLVLEHFAAVLTPFLQAGFIAVVAGQPMSWVRKRLRIPHSVAAILVGVGLTLAFVLLGHLPNNAGEGCRQPVLPLRGSTGCATKDR